MRNFSFYKTILFLTLFFVAVSASAWTHGISIGYGSAKDPNHNQFTNSGEFLSAEFLSLAQRSWLNFTFNGSLGNFYTNAPIHKHLFTGALSLAARFYFLQFMNVHPFFLASAGPAFMTNRHFGLNNQGSDFTFQSALGFGAEFGQKNRIDLNMRMIHYSNATLILPDQGFNFFYVVSLGYLFGQ